VATGNHQAGVEKAILPVPLSVVAATSSAYGFCAAGGHTCDLQGRGSWRVFTPSQPQTTNATGSVTFTYQLPSKPQAVTITCTSTGYIGTSFTETSTVGAPSRILISPGTTRRRRQIRRWQRLWS